jgi:cyclophilin family peptidyl-prolyl cis-trans isomerase
VAQRVTPPPRRLVPAASASAQRMRITMARGGSFDLRLFPDEAPATVARVVTLARKGYYNGLTFHRVVPNFVLQGGSPGANEYVGDGPFMRDELGLRTHARGTLGISTRGRDTGDAQLFINLVDNPRLDHNFTVFAEITAGMDVVDAVLEGDVIDRIDVLDQASTQSRP